MSDKKYNFGSPSIMKAIQSGEKALFKFQGEPVTVDTEWGVKYSVPILLLSHPQYPNIPKKGMEMAWQTGAKVITDIVELFKAGNKDFNKDYYELIWELTCADDGSFWLNA